MEKIRVVELFAGVGGFRIGLENADPRFEIVWSDQWEPGAAKQWASDIYVKHWGEKGHSNEDIAKVPSGKIPPFDLICGGFPCQDYSVARTLNQAAGLIGKKGVLWWEIHRILSEKKQKPHYLFLENVDRLLVSPASQRGRDFGIMLASLSDLGYAVEWRVINAAEYGLPQRRRRVFILGYHIDSPIYAKIDAKRQTDQQDDALEPSFAYKWLMRDGVLARAFPVADDGQDFSSYKIDGGLEDISKTFGAGKAGRRFGNCGMIMDRIVHTRKVEPNYDGPRTLLGDIIVKDPEKVPERYYLDKGSLEKWEYLKGSKRDKRVSRSSGVEYSYNEGAMSFPDPLDRPARTIVTSEGGNTPSRFKHVVQMPDGRLRRLMPIELERANMFPDDHTLIEGISDIKRAFMMGNALVVGVITKIGKSLFAHLDEITGDHHEKSEKG